MSWVSARVDQAWRIQDQGNGFRAAIIGTQRARVDPMGRIPDQGNGCLLP